MITTLTTTLLAAGMFALSPFSPNPDPNIPTVPNPGVLLPNYTINGDGTRMQCTPNLNQCWRDTTGLPSYLTGTP